MLVINSSRYCASCCFRSSFFVSEFLRFSTFFQLLAQLPDTFLSPHSQIKVGFSIRFRTSHIEFTCHPTWSSLVVRVSELIITLLPHDPEGLINEVNITAPPSLGNLYQTSFNFETFGYSPTRSVQITNVNTTVSSPTYRVVYVPPPNFVATTFGYSGQSTCLFCLSLIAKFSVLPFFHVVLSCSCSLIVVFWLV